MLSGCSLLGDDGLPERTTWRGDAIDAVEATPGVVKTTVDVKDVDNNLGSKVPTVYGDVWVEEDMAKVYDDVLTRLSDALGPGSHGVDVDVEVIVPDLPDTPTAVSLGPDDLGYSPVRNGEDLWEVTH